MNKRKDLRNLPFITIDGEETKDIDDAVYVERHDNGYTLYVAIADVSHFVKPGSELDMQARLKTSTEYLLGQTKHMFPDELSQDACSLVKQQERLVAVCQMEFNTKGVRQSYEFYKGIINSKDEVNYKRVNGLLRNELSYTDYDKSYNLKKVLKDAKALSWQLKLRREEAQNNKSNFGSEPKYQLDEDKKRIIAIIPNPRDISEKMIENFMIQTNLAAGDYIYKKTKSGIVRKHKKLTDDNYARLCEKAKKRYDLDVSKGDVMNDFSGFEGHIQKQLRAMLIEEYSHAEYTQDMKDNFHEGLTVTNYTHFTSPIRRYSDILAHRLIFDELDNLEDEYIEVPHQKLNKETGELDEVLEKIHITKHISDRAVVIKKEERAHLRRMLDAYYLEFCLNKTRRATVLSDMYKDKIVMNHETGEEEKKEFYCGTFVKFYEGDEVKVMLPERLRKIDSDIIVKYTKDEKFSKKKGTDIYNWGILDNEKKRNQNKYKNKTKRRQEFSRKNYK